MAVGRPPIAGPGRSSSVLVKSLGWYPLTVATGRLLMKALDVRLTVEGEGHIPLTGPVILAANHSAYVDFVPLAATVNQRGREARFFIRQDVWKGPVGYALSQMRHIPVDRGVPAAAYLQARRLLHEGELLSTFPEAGISYSFTIRSLMRGTAALAQATGAVVVPVAVWGPQRIFSVGRPRNGNPNRRDFTRGRAVDVLCGPPMPAPGEDLTAWTRDLGGVLTTLLEEVQTRPQHLPAPGEFAPWYPAHLGGHAPDRREALAFDVVPRSAISPTWGPASNS